MEFTSTEIQERLDFFYELLQCNNHVYTWTYDASGGILHTTCPDLVLDNFFTSNGLSEDMLEFSKEHYHPLILSNELGMMWCCGYEKKDGILKRIHVIGPVFSSRLSDESMKEVLKNPNIRASWKPKMEKILRRISTVTANEFIRQALQLHYCITGENLRPSNITFLRNNHMESVLQGASGDLDYDKLWVNEEELLKILEKGNIHYKKTFRPGSSLIVTPATDKDFQHAKALMSIFTGLCIRTSIQGGLSPETAYIRGNMYLQNIIEANAFPEALQTVHSMYEDFLYLVHNHQNRGKYSKQIQDCMDYVNLHLTEKISIPTLAAHIGYTDYYLSRKFKSEVGKSINTYIKDMRIAQAEYLLCSTNDSIQDISDKLQFGTRSFFAKVFRECTGMPPAQYRQTHKKVSG